MITNQNYNHTHGDDEDDVVHFKLDCVVMSESKGMLIELSWMGQLANGGLQFM